METALDSVKWNTDFEADSLKKLCSSPLVGGCEK